MLRNLGLPFLRTFTAVAALAATFAAAPAAHAVTDAERAAARAAANEGFDAFEQRNWPDVVDRFKRAEGLFHSPVHLLYIARAQAQLGQLVEAYENYTKVAREVIQPGSPPAFTEAQKDAGKELAEIEPRVPHVTLEVEGAGSEPLKVTLDGTEIPATLIGISNPVNPGERKFMVTSGALKGEAAITVTEGSKQKVVVKLSGSGDAAASPASGAADKGGAGSAAAQGSVNTDTLADQGSGGGSPVLGYVALGVGVVGLGVGTVFALQAKSKWSEADDLCSGPGGRCSILEKSKVEGLDSDGKTASTLSIVSFAVGAVGIGAGVFLLTSGGGKKEAPPATASITPWVGLGSAGVNGRF